MPKLKQLVIGTGTIVGGITAMRTGVFGRSEYELRDAVGHSNVFLVYTDISLETDYLFDKIHYEESYHNYGPGYKPFLTKRHTKMSFRPIDLKCYSAHGTLRRELSGCDYTNIMELKLLLDWIDIKI